jgi:hypothetical protein
MNGEALYYRFAHKKSRIFRCGFFRSSQKANYFAAGAAGAASSFLTSAFLAFFAFLAFLAGFASFFSAAGAAASAGAAAGLAASAAKTTAEKETATRAATIVDRTFFICTTSKKNVCGFFIADGVPKQVNFTNI